MAYVDKNPLTRGLRGRVSTMIFRKDGDRTIVSDFPSKSEAPPTEVQTTQRERFKRAASDAKVQMRDPLSKAAYEKDAKKRKMEGAFVAAVTDFYSAPKITDAAVDAYKGQAGDKIRIFVDDVFVTSVVVEIFGGN